MGNHHNARLQEDWKRDGAEAFVFEFLEAFTDRDEMKRCERELRARLDPYYNASPVLRKTTAPEPRADIRAGDRFGYWTVESEAPRKRAGKQHWHCRCDCGRTRQVDGYTLQTGVSTSCGCSKRVNSIASILGRLIVQENGCCIWPGSQHDFGYGMVNFERKHWYVHRLLYEYFVGPIPEGLVLDHVFCSNPPCANWAHLEPKTVSQNSARSKRALQTHCKNGHPLSGENLRMERLRGGTWARGCLACRVAYDRSRCALKTQRAREKRQRLRAARENPDD